MRTPIWMTAATAGLALAGCATSPYGASRNNAANRTIIGAGGGAALGAVAGAVTGGGALEGAVIGAVAGGALGAVVNPKAGNGRVYRRGTQGYCYYVDRDGKVIYDYEARC